VQAWWLLLFHMWRAANRLTTAMNRATYAIAGGGAVEAIYRDGLSKRRPTIYDDGFNAHSPRVSSGRTVLMGIVQHVYCCSILAVVLCYSPTMWAVAVRKILA